MGEKINAILKELQSLSVPSTFGNIRALNNAMVMLANLNEEVAAMESELRAVKGDETK